MGKLESAVLEPGAERIVPGPAPSRPEDEESLDVWGFRDTAFRVNSRGNVELTGSRYPLSGSELPDLLPWMQNVLEVELDPRDTHPSAYPPTVPPSRVKPELLEVLGKCLGDGAICEDPAIRLRHAHGHTQQEMYAIKYGDLERVPDLVVFPSQEDQVATLVEVALQHDVCLIPYGGGTNVTEALRCPVDEERTILSVDMRRMNRILWIDPTNQMARIEAGAVGRDIAEQLESFGFTMGHEPDSVELSTLGGWIATHASGMKKNRYGNIEDLILDVNAVTGQGKLSRSSVAPRESVGTDSRRSMLGSEGTLGIITSAVVKIFPVPEVERYGSILFPSFSEGVAFLYALTRAGAPPASVRLVDNLQFQFGQALKPRTRGWRVLRSKAEKWYVTRVRGFDPDAMVACTLVFEGTARDVRAQQARVYRIAARHRGMKAGSANGARGYQLTFGIAYIRDFVMNHYILGESFETSVPWSQVSSLCDNVKRRLLEEHEKRGLPGKPFLTCRVTQLYQTGVCVYFYFAYYHRGVESPSEVYAELERAARDEILRSGGSLSHHHGVGKLRQGFLPDIMSPAALEWTQRVKRAVDPQNVFGSANQQPSGQGRFEP
jgi:alkyldihydroxyacetonephosphate synthase